MAIKLPDRQAQPPVTKQLTADMNVSAGSSEPSPATKGALTQLMAGLVMWRSSYCLADLAVRVHMQKGTHSHDGSTCAHGSGGFATVVADLHGGQAASHATPYNQCIQLMGFFRSFFLFNRWGPDTGWELSKDGRLPDVSGDVR